MNRLLKPAVKLVESPLVYLVCFAMLPILAGYADTLGEFLPRDAFILCAICAGTTIVLYELLKRLLRNPHQSAFCLWIGIIAFFSYGDISRCVKAAMGVSIHTFPRPALAGIYLLCVAVPILLVGRSKLFWRHHTAALNLVAIGLCLFNLSLIVAHEFELEKTVSSIRSVFDRLNISASTQAIKPDIYLIVLDEFANSNTLKSDYGYDNSSFINYLAGKGFHVEQFSSSNYDRTVLSFCSFLNMQYLDDAITLLHGQRDTASPYFGNGPLAAEQAGCAPIFRITQQSRALRLLKENGYRLINICSGYGATDFLLDADENAGCGLRNRFDAGLLSSTVLRCLDNKFHLLRSLYAENSLAIFQWVPAVAARPGPKFVLAHSLVCHEPYIFDERGTELPLPHGSCSVAEHRRQYLAQLKFAQKKVQTLIDAILNIKGPRPVVVLLSDHGPRPYWQSQGWDQQYVNEHFKNFTAFYFPDGDYSSVGSSISAVNVLRLVFNKYLGTDLPLLPDRCIVVPDGGPWRQYEVTGLLSFKQPLASSP